MSSILHLVSTIQYNICLLHFGANICFNENEFIFENNSERLEFTLHSDKEVHTW